MPEIIKTKSGGVTTAYLLFAVLATVSFGLALSDLSFIYFAILILSTFALSAISNGGSAQKRLAGIGWSDRNMSVAIPYGIIGGLLTIFIGTFFLKLTPQTSSLISPDFSATASIVTGSIIPVSFAVAFNIIGQWLITAPAEEAGYRIVAPFAALSAFGNEFVAFGIATLLWVFTHVPTYVNQKAPIGMYFILVFLALVTIFLIKITGTIMSAIVAHATYNTVVIMTAAPADGITMLVILAIFMSLLYVWNRGRK